MPNSVSHSSGYSHSNSHDAVRSEDGKFERLAVENKSLSFGSKIWKLDNPPVDELYSSPDCVVLKCRFTNKGAQEAKQLLEIAKPHTDTRELTIENYSEAEFPDWVGDPSFTRLTSVALIACHEIRDCLPPSLSLLPCLEKLKVIGLPITNFNIRTDTDEVPRYPSLRLLTLMDMFELEAWRGLKEYDFPNIRRLEFSGCTRLREIPRFKSLTRIALASCHSLTTLPALEFLSCLDVANCDSLVSLPCFESLLRFYVASCHSLATLPALQALTDLKVDDCDGLVKLPHAPSLKRLRVSRCAELTSIDFISPSCSTFSAWQDRILSLKILEVSLCPILSYPPPAMDDGEEHPSSSNNEPTSQALPLSFDKLTLKKLFHGDQGGNPKSYLSSSNWAHIFMFGLSELFLIDS